MRVSALAQSTEREAMSERMLKMLRQYRRADVGTLWTMTRRDSEARCALLSWPKYLELCVVVNGEPLLTKRCSRADEAFSLAEQWRQRMLERGWRQIVPGARVPLADEDRQSA